MHVGALWSRGPRYRAERNVDFPNRHSFSPSTWKVNGTGLRPSSITYVRFTQLLCHNVPFKTNFRSVISSGVGLLAPRYGYVLALRCTHGPFQDPELERHWVQPLSARGDLEALIGLAG